MDSEKCVNLLVNIIFSKEVPNVKEIVAENPSSISASLLSEDFIRSVKDVLRVRRFVVLHRWRILVDTCFEKMLSSYEMYLRFVMFACVREHDCYNSVFESFVSVCALVKLICDGMLQETGVNFSDLIPDILILFYQTKMHNAFNRPQLGFQGFVKYIQGHRYLKWKLKKKPVSPAEANVSFDYIPEEFEEKIKKELKRENVTEERFNPEKIAVDNLNRILADLVLSVTKAELPTLPTCENLLIAHEKNKLVKMTEKMETVAAEKAGDIDTSLPGCSSSNSESKVNCDPKDQDNTERYEDIIQAVIRHNHSKKQGNKNSTNRIQEEAEGLLEQLNDKIESLVDVLDN